MSYPYFEILIFEEKYCLYFVKQAGQHAIHMADFHRHIALEYPFRNYMMNFIARDKLDKLMKKLKTNGQAKFKAKKGGEYFTGIPSNPSTFPPAGRPRKKNVLS